VVPEDGEGVGGGERVGDGVKDGVGVDAAIREQLRREGGYLQVEKMALLTP
jgi:hypothetical protein